MIDWRCQRCHHLVYVCRCPNTWTPGDALPESWEAFLEAIPDPDAPHWDQQFPLPGPPARLVVAAGEGEQAIVLFRSGAQIDCELEHSWHLDDLGLGAPPALGISIWEGSITWTPGGGEYYYDGDVDWDGCWRRPTAGEWYYISRGLNPWTTDLHLPTSRQRPPEDMVDVGSGRFLPPVYAKTKRE